MEIGLFYSRENLEHCQTADLIKQAAKNLGLSASIVEVDNKVSEPKVVIDGIDMSSSLPDTTSKYGLSRAYNSIVNLLEKSAWNALI